MGTRADPIGIVVPTRWEAQELLRRFKFKKCAPAFFRSEIQGRTLLLILSGMGRPAAVHAAERLIAEGARTLLSMGFCGALIPDLKVGDLVTDRLVTATEPARNLEERQALAARANAVAVDMETQAVVEVGTRRGVPIHFLRVVSDEVGEDLCPLLGSKGALSPWRIAWRILNPGTWPLAHRLFLNSLVARRRLADALDGFVRKS
jgi:adenosylhomocysteine nucleosidase